MDAARRPIGVFDSGVGGLTVLRALMERLPGESTAYLGDTARVPYGAKSAAVVTRYALNNARFLSASDMKALVVACNTASAVALAALADALPVPVVGVIEPGALAAARATRVGHVAVVGTHGTIRSGAYQAAIARARPGTKVTTQACPLFVPLAEEGWTDGAVVDAVARTYLSCVAVSGADVLVLGCTHYPLLRGAIAAVVGPSIELVDSATATAEAVASLLGRLGLAAPPGQASHRFFATDSPERFTEVGARFLGRPIESAEAVDL